MAATCSPAYISYNMSYDGNLIMKNYDERYRLPYDSLAIIVSSRYVSYVGGIWGVEVYLGLENHHKVPVKVDLRNMDLKIDNYVLQHKYSHISDKIDLPSSGRYIRLDTTTEIVTIPPQDSFYFLNHFIGQPKLKLRTARGNIEILRALLTLKNIYVGGVELQFKSFTLTPGRM